MTHASARPPLTLDEVRRRTALRLQQALERYKDIGELLHSADGYGFEWAVVGGAPRYWALGVPSEPNDLDIVVDVHQKSLKYLISAWAEGKSSTVKISATAFGGFRLDTPTGAADIWSVAASVGVVQKKVGKSTRFKAVARSAALSLDSLVITSKGQVYEYGFFDSVNTGILHLNHCHVERADRVAAKAVRLCHEYQMTPDLSVQAFLLAASRTK